MTGLSVRRNFAWTFAGSTLYNMSQWLLVLFLAHLADPSVVGQFSLSLAITAPVFLTVGMNLRNSQATDAMHRFDLTSYLTLTHVLNAVAIALSVVVGLFLGLEGDALLVVLAIAGAKAVEGLSKTYYGYLQQRRRLDVVSRSMMLRSIAGPTLFLGTFVTAGHLAAGAVGMAIGWALVQVLHDRPNIVRHYQQECGRTSLPHLMPIEWSEIRSLAKRSAPLGVDAGISSLAQNVPRYAVQTALGSAQLGVFASIGYLGQTVSMITSSMQAAVLPQLAVLHHQGERRAFVRLLTQLALFGLSVTTVSVIGAALLGRPVLELILPPEYVRPDLLIILMIGAGLTTLQRSLCTGIEAAQHFRTYVVIDAITTTSIALFAWPAASVWGLQGAAWSLSVGFMAGCIAATPVLVRVIRAMPSSEAP